MTFFKHETAICESDAIGDDTKLWAFTHILPGARIGQECNICDFVFIENDVVIGDRVTIKSGVQLWDGIRIDDDVFIGPNVTFTNDIFPRSKRHLSHFPLTSIRRGASVGANSTLLPGITLGEGCMVGAGSVVTKSVPPHAIIYGNPAQVRGYVESENLIDATPDPLTKENQEAKSLPGNSKLLDLKSASDARGNLIAINFKDYLNFSVERVFYIFDVPSHQIRGAHAHIECNQFLIALQGSVRILLDDGHQRSEIKLNKPDQGLLIPPKVWSCQYEFSKDSLVLVLASHPYDEKDYIHVYEEFRDISQLPG